jgi:hypothetical protein
MAFPFSSEGLHKQPKAAISGVSVPWLAPDDCHPMALVPHLEPIPEGVGVIAGSVSVCFAESTEHGDIFALDPL